MAAPAASQSNGLLPGLKMADPQAARCVLAARSAIDFGAYAHTRAGLIPALRAELCCSALAWQIR